MCSLNNRFLQKDYHGSCAQNVDDIGTPVSGAQAPGARVPGARFPGAQVLSCGWLWLELRNAVLHKKANANFFLTNRGLVNQFQDHIPWYKYVIA
jgi:hypothetical protein